ncbi:PREDICTED: auxilin-like protein 1 [Tarenaya hassleriana]|uniref:auxilin-like protein 1 n=1 Tax=Tarenaya hassleriana TaxID=28532 RepID=UPI00053C8ECE|nr:PREDICTED: auxilin-like protein 1 [Tarenaya hassleriana]
MEYEKPPTAPVFSRKHRNRSHSLSFSANGVYDGVFSSPATKKPTPAIDYGEIFRGSGPSSSSIPFLDLPELNEEKIKIDVRSSKLDYASVFGGFVGCDFTVSPEELIIKSEKKSSAEADKRNHKKAGKSFVIPPSTKLKNQISSPEVVSMKQFNVLYHQTTPLNENGIKDKTQAAQFHAVSGYTQLVENPCPLSKIESRSLVSSVEKEPHHGNPVKVADCNTAQVDIPSSNGSRKRSSKNNTEFEMIFGRNGSSVGDIFTSSESKTDLNAKHPDVIPPSCSLDSDKKASERSKVPNSGSLESFRSEDVDLPCSPPYFDEETDANSVAAASSAVLKKALEEAQLRINMAKQMMERKKAGSRSSRAKPRSSGGLRVADKGNRKFGSHRDDGTESVGEVVKSSEEPFPLEGERFFDESVNYSNQSFPNSGKLNVGEAVNSSKESSPNAGNRNVDESVISSEQSFLDKGENIVGEVVNSSEQSTGYGKEQNVGEEVNLSEQLILNGRQKNVGEAVKSSEKSLPKWGGQNVGESVNSSEQSIMRWGEQNLGEALKSSEQSIPKRGELNVGDVVNPLEQSIPKWGEQNPAEAVKSSEKSFPKWREQNAGELVKSSEQSIPKWGDQNLGEAAKSSEQSIPKRGEQNIGEMVNSSEQSSPKRGEQNVGEAVNSSEQSIPEGGEQNVAGSVKSSEQSIIPNGGENNVVEVVISSEKSILNEVERNDGETMKSSEQSIPNEVGHIVSELVNSSEQSFRNAGNRNAGEAVNSSEQLFPDEGEQNIGEAAIFSEKIISNEGEQDVSPEQSIPNKIEKNVDKVVDSSERSFPDKGEPNLGEIPDEEEQNVGEEESSCKQSSPEQGEQQAKRARRRLWEVPGGILKSTLHHMQEEMKEQEEEHAKKARKHWELPGGISRTNEEMQKVTGNSFYSFGQLGNKLKCVVEAFTGSKVAQTSEAEGAEHVMVQNREGEDKIVYTNICEREEEEIHRESLTQRDENDGSTLCNSTEVCSQKEEKETGRCEQSENGSGSCNTHENSDLIHEILDREGEKESLSEPREMLVGDVDAETYEREVGEIHRPTQIDENAKSMASILGENALVFGHNGKGNENENKTPRRRRVWKTSEDVYDMIKGMKRYDRAWQLEDDEKETMKRCLREQSERADNDNDDITRDEETESISELPTDTGLQENWNVLKQMFRQMFQTVDTKREDENRSLLESEQSEIEIHQRDEGMDRKGTAGTSDDEDSTLALQTLCRKKDGEMEEQNKPCFVYELIGEEELVGPEMAKILEVEDVPEVSEADSLDLGAASELEEIKEQADSRTEILRHDYPCSSDKKSEQKPCKELAEETNMGGSIDDNMRDPSFESARIGEVGLEQKIYDRYPENTGSTSSMEEHIEEVDSESNKSGWDVDDMQFIGQPNENDNYSESEARHSPETKHKLRENAGNPDHEFPEEFNDRNEMEAASMPGSSSKEDEEKVAAADRNTDATTDDASQNKAEPAEEHNNKMIDEAKGKAKERENERIMVERAIREARERAFADARERAERAAMEKAANAGTHRRKTSEIRGGRPEKTSVDATDKLSSAEKASMQAKLRAERAAVERALSEARERALEKALSGKARNQAGKSSAASGERRNFSFSGTENRNSAAPSGSSNPNSNGEPAQRCKARSERHQRTTERAEKALAEKKLRDLIAQKEQAERNRLAETLDAEVKRWSSGKEGNLRALLSTLQYILGPESGWKPIHLTDLVSSASVRKAYRKATLYVHPDKLQQRGAATQQKYICEKVFDLLKEAWNKFGVEER